MIVTIALTVENLQAVDPDLLVSTVTGNDMDGVLVPVAIVGGVEAFGLVDVLHERIGLRRARVIVRGELHACVLEPGRTTRKSADSVGISWIGIPTLGHEPLE